ncbi:MAG: DNA polymerase III subunit beta [Termitinemataceae bacterium]|nr:MAG: DNA polymerase III subunit beta [Termitinemataceae bacterium]
MKFVCEKSALIKEISIAQEVIVAKNPISVLSSIYLETADQAIIIKSSDIKLNFMTKVPVSVLDAGKVTIKADTLLSIISSLPEGEMEFETTDNKMIIRHSVGKKKIEYKPKVNIAEQYPDFPMPDDITFFELQIKDFKTMIRQTIFSISDDETRFFMTGVYFEKVENKIVMVSTDGRRLAYIEQELETAIPDFEGIIIPEKILNVILKRSSDEGNVSIGISKNHIFINFASYNFSSVLIEGQFPNYRRVIPEDNNIKFVVNRVDVIDAIMRVSKMVEKKSKRVYFQFKKDVLIIYSEESDIGDAKEELFCEYDGDEISIAMNYHYIEESFKAMEEEKN